MKKNHQAFFRHHLFGDVVYGVTTKRRVVFARPFPNPPKGVQVDGAFFITEITPFGFTLDIKPERPVSWVAMEFNFSLFSQNSNYNQVIKALQKCD